MTDSRASSPKTAARAAKAAAPAAKVAKPSKAAEPTKALVAVAKVSSMPTHRHPNLGLAPVDMTAGYPAAAEKLRVDVLRVAAASLEVAAKSDPTLGGRYDEAGLRRLLRDAELIVERLAMCLASDDVRWLAEYAQWVAPLYRRRGVPLGDLSAMCAGIRSTLEPMLGPDELAVADRSLGAATAVFQAMGRIAGDRHKRGALWKWMYRGV